MKNIVMAYDTSEQAKKAFDFAAEMAQKYGAQLTVLSVVRPPEPAESVETGAMLEEASHIYAADFAKLKKKTAPLKIKAKFEVAIGHPAEKIIQRANALKADAIVMGHRGKSLMERWLLGSISKRVISYAHCTVIVVR